MALKYYFIENLSSERRIFNIERILTNAQSQGNLQGYFCLCIWLFVNFGTATYQFHRVSWGRGQEDLSLDWARTGESKVLLFTHIN